MDRKNIKFFDSNVVLYKNNIVFRNWHEFKYFVFATKPFKAEQSFSNNDLA